MLDTDMTGYIARRRHNIVIQRFEAVSPDDVCISAITRAEILMGLQPLDPMHRLHFTIRRFLQQVDVLPWDSAAADAYPGIAWTLRQAGLPIGTMDTLIAAHAISIDATLVTSNTRHFLRIPQLRLENWTLPPG